MHRETAPNGTERDKSKRCAVIKIDFNGRFVYIDNLAERFFGLPSENLFGQSIKEYLDENSYTLLLSVLPAQKHYESFYEATRLVFIDARKDRREVDIIMSLNFIAGNPANYQIIINPLNEVLNPVEGCSSFEAMPRHLIEYVSGIGRNADWKKLCGLFVSLDEIIQMGIYRLVNDELELLGDEASEMPSDMKADLSKTGKNLVTGVMKGNPFIEKRSTESKKGESGGTFDIYDASFALMHDGQCWGVLRFIYSDSAPDIKENLNNFAAFLGNALYAHAVSPQINRQPVSV